MSLKISKTEKKKPRAMPVETIVTRFKSKQKLLEKEQPNTTNNVKKQKLKKKITTNPKKVMKQLKKMDVAERNEIYPDKIKRKIVNKKIMLVPKHSYRVIGRIKGCNKRKLRIPQKEISSPRQRLNLNSFNELKNKQPDMSIIDMVKIIEDSKSLDDEDLLEILTCPSPVWWEDPPDGYIEEAIFSRPQAKFEQKSVKIQLLEEQIKEEQNKIDLKTKEDLPSPNLDMKICPIEINVNSNDKTFVKKRSKLQIVLDNIIKSKINEEIKSEANFTSKFGNSANLKSNSANLKSNSANLKSNSANLKSNSATSITNSAKIKLKKSIQKPQAKKQRKTMKSNKINKSKLTTNSKKSKLVSKSKKKRNSDSFKLSDIEDDILENLENMEIPIEDKDGNKTNSNINIKKKQKDSIDEDVKEKEKSRRLSVNSNRSDKNVSEEVEYLDLSVFDDVLTNDIDCNKSLEFNEIQTSNSNEVNTEYVTVYKIINNEVHNDINELKIVLPVKNKYEKFKDGGRINDYYKQCKRVNLEKMVTNDEIVSRASEKSILISESESIRYCYKCSSIFDKQCCDYCEKKTLKKKRIVFFCDFCGFKVYSRQEIVKHLEIHQ